MKNKLLLLAFIFIASAQASFAQVPSYVPTNGLVGWWPFNGNANDESGNGNNGTINGAVLTADRNGNPNSAFYFSGAGCATYIQANVNTTSIQSGLTISIWLLRAGPGCIGPRILEFGNNPVWNDGPGVAQWGWDNNYSYGGYGSTTSTGQSVFSAFNPRANNVWTHLVYTNDGSFGRFYQDGQLINTLASTGNPILGSSVAFGRMNHPAYDALNGKLDDIGVWNRALTQQEISGLYTSQSPCTINGNILAQDTIRACGTSYSLDAGSGYSSYAWNTGATTQTISVTSTGWYRCNVTQSSCSATDSVFVSLLNAQIVNNDTTICSGTQVQLTAIGNCPGSGTGSLQWQLLIPGSSFIGSETNFSPSGFNQSTSTLYSVYRTGSINRVYAFNLLNNSVTSLTSNNAPGELYSYAFDFTNSRLLASRVGRDVVYSLPLSGGSWQQIGSGGFDAESYGSNAFWNPVSGRFGYFGGYGYYATKNWIWENNTSGWVNTYVNNNNCNPARRVGNKIATNGSGNKLYIFSGQGSCDGNQFASSCSLGSPWPTDVGVYCWLRDLWELDLSNYQFTNILPVNNQTINREGAFAFDYSTNTFYNIGGRAPTSSYAVYTPFTMDVARFRRGVDAGFSNITVGGVPPSADRDGLAFYDGNGNRIIYARNDGIWAINLGSSCNLTYLWSTGATTPTISVSPTQTTTYYCTISNGISSCTDSVKVMVNNLSGNLFVQDTIRACGTSYTIDAGAGYSSYAWNTGATTQTISLNTTGWYRCIVTSGPCNGSDSVFVSLVNTQIIQNDTTICSGQNLVITAQLQPGSSANPNIGPLVAQQYLSFTGPSSFTINNLPAGDYIIEASGTFCYGSCWIGKTVDPAYSFYQTIQPFIGSFSINQYCPQGTSGCTYPRPINDVYNSNHVYYYSYHSNGGNLTIYGLADECCWWDNIDGLAFKVYQSVSSNSILWSTGATTPSISVSPSQTTTYYCTISNGISSCTDSVRITVNQPTSGSQSINSCSSYNWQGTTYTQSGTYTRTFTNAAGCDSTATLILTINQPSSGSSSVTACGSYTWQGTTYTQSGTYTRTITNAAGCDSTATLLLTINQPSSGSSSITACSSYTWQGTTYTLSGTYTYTLTNAAGCDSTATLILTINQPSSGSSSITACGSYTWQGTTYTQGGTYMRNLINAAGCDSSATLILTINQPSSGSSSITACGSYTWQGTTYTQGGTYTRTLTNAAGCDSTATLILTVNQPSSGSSSVTACGSYTWQGTTYTQGGTYMRTLTNAAGCDSVATLNLTIQSAVTPTIQITTSASGQIAPGTSITFTATITSGGSSPVYQWKKNGINVGTNSASYTDTQWMDGDIVTCTLTSNATCITTSTVTSNSITVQVTSLSSTARFLVVDVFQNRACYYDSLFNFITSNILSTNVLYATTNVSDVVATPTRVYVLDGVNSVVYQSSASNTVALRSRTLRTNSGGKLSGPTGLTLSGDTLWVLDPKNNFIYRYSLASIFSGSGTVNAQVKMTLSNTNNKGEALWNDAGNLYVLDNGTSKTIYRYRKSGGTPAISKALRTANGGTLSTVTGMTVRNGIVYVTDRTQDKVYPYPLSSLYTGTGTLNASAIYQLNLVNLDPTGITVVSNTSTARVVDENTITSEPSVFPVTSSLYPNPANGDVVIRYSANQSGISYAAIYSLNGQLVYQTERSPYEQGENELALPIAAEPLPNGVYFVRLICSDRVDDLRLIIAR